MRPPGSAVPRCESCLASSGFKRLCVWCGKERMFVVRGGGSPLLSLTYASTLLYSPGTNTHSHSLPFSLSPAAGRGHRLRLLPLGRDHRIGVQGRERATVDPNRQGNEKRSAFTRMTAHMTAHSTLSTLSTHGAQGTQYQTMLPQTTLPHSARVYTMVVFLCIRGSFGSLLTTN